MLYMESYVSYTVSVCFYFDRDVQALNDYLHGSNTKPVSVTNCATQPNLTPGANVVRTE